MSDLNDCAFERSTGIEPGVPPARTALRLMSVGIEIESASKLLLALFRGGSGNRSSVCGAKFQNSGRGAVWFRRGEFTLADGGVKPPGRVSRTELALAIQTLAFKLY